MIFNAMIITINNIMENVSLTQAGNVLYDKMNECVLTEDKLVMDMSGVSSIPSIFLNMSFGQFIDKYGVEKLKNMVSFTNITRTQAERITDYLKRYKS